MRKPNTVMRGMNFSQLKVCAENAGIDYMDVITFVGK